MIDTHAHAFPNLDHYTAQLGPGQAPAKSLLSLAGRLPRLLGTIAPSVGGGPLLGIERVAAMRRDASPRVAATLEATLSTMAAPAVLCTGTLNRLIESMDRHGVQRTVLISGPPVATNAWLLRTCREQAGGRFIAVPTLPDVPADADAAAWAAGFEKLADGGAGGFKLHANLEGLPPRHAAYRAMFEVARARGLFVIIHTGCFEIVSYKRKAPSEPADFAHLLQDYPEVKVCLAHMNRDHPERAWEVMRRFEQVYTDTSWQPAERIRQAVREVGLERILLGSDWPLLHPDLQGDALAVLRAAVSEADAERIGVANAEAFLGI